MSRKLAAGFAAALVLAATMVIAAPALAGGTCHEPASSALSNTVKMEGACFLPSVTYAKPGKVRFVNGPDSVAHTVTGLAHEWGTELRPDTSATVRFDDPGVYPYFCAYHPGMIGAVVIGDAAGLGVRDLSLEPEAPVEEAVDPVADPVHDAVDDAVEDAVDLEAVPVSSGSAGPSTPVVAIAAAGMGVAAGLVLRGRPRTLPG